MEVSGLQGMRNEAVHQSKDIALMKQGIELEKTMVNELLASLPNGSVDSSKAPGQQVRIQA